MPLLGMLTNRIVWYAAVAVVIALGWFHIQALGARLDAAAQRAAVATEAAKTSAATADRLKADADRNAALAAASAEERDRAREEAARVRTTIVRIPVGPTQCRDMLRALADGLPVRADHGAGGPVRGPTAAGPPRVAVPARP